MLEDILGRASWPLALIIIVLVAGIATYSINESNHKTKVRIACIQEHGIVHERINEWPTCTYPK